MSEHTPGPWRIGLAHMQGAIRIEAEDSPHIGSVRYSQNPKLNRERGEANARLIAAAPDLLAAAKEMIPAIGKLRGIDPVDAAHDLAVEDLNGPEDRLLAAIVKAEGRL